MNLLTSPLFLRVAVVLVAGGFSFAIGTILIRRMRRNLLAETLPEDTPASLETLPLFTYQAVIQELKLQKYVLQYIQSSERRRAKTSVNISAAVLAHLPVGVLFITPSGLVRQANHAARQILGFASPVGMSVADIFRDAHTVPNFEETPPVAEILAESLRQKTPFRQLGARYTTPSTE